jgi:hypothetical protein
MGRGLEGITVSQDRQAKAWAPPSDALTEKNMHSAGRHLQTRLSTLEGHNWWPGDAHANETVESLTAQQTAEAPLGPKNRRLCQELQRRRLATLLLQSLRGDSLGHATAIWNR